jgi:hypothetical protein
MKKIIASLLIIWITSITITFCVYWFKTNEIYLMSLMFVLTIYGFIQLINVNR